MRQAQGDRQPFGATRDFQHLAQDRTKVDPQRSLKRNVQGELFGESSAR